MPALKVSVRVLVNALGGKMMEGGYGVHDEGGVGVKSCGGMRKYGCVVSIPLDRRLRYGFPTGSLPAAVPR